MQPTTLLPPAGQMVLFTSPEDMVIGQSVVLQHRKEITSETAATRLKTVNKLVSSSLNYEPNKVRCMCCIECTYSNIEHNEEGVKTHSLANRQRTSVCGILYKPTSICVDIYMSMKS